MFFCTKIAILHIRIINGYRNTVKTNVGIRFFGLYLSIHFTNVKAMLPITR